METIFLNNIVENFSELSLEDKEYVLDIFHKQIIESRREKLLARAREAEMNLVKGNVKKGSVKDLYEDLEDG